MNDEREREPHHGRQDVCRPERRSRPRFDELHHHDPDRRTRARQIPQDRGRGRRGESSHFDRPRIQIVACAGSTARDGVERLGLAPSSRSTALRRCAANAATVSRVISARLTAIDTRCTRRATGLNRRRRGQRRQPRHPPRGERQQICARRHQADERADQQRRQDRVREGPADQAIDVVEAVPEEPDADAERQRERAQ